VGKTREHEQCFEIAKEKHNSANFGSDGATLLEHLGWERELELEIPAARSTSAFARVLKICAKLKPRRDVFREGWGWGGSCSELVRRTVRGSGNRLNGTTQEKKNPVCRRRSWNKEKH